MDNIHEVTFTLIVDGLGNAEVGKDEEEARERFGFEHGDAEGGQRVYELVLKVPGPATTRVEATIPDKVEGPVTVTVS